MWYWHWSLKYSDFDFRGLARAKQAFKSQNYEDIIPACNEEIETDENHKMEALVLRATFYLLLGEHNKALSDLEVVIENVDANVKVIRVKHTVIQISLIVYAFVCINITVIIHTNPEFFIRHLQHFIIHKSLLAVMNILVSQFLTHSVSSG